MKKTLLHILSRTAWTLVGIFVALVVLLRIPYVQTKIAGTISAAMEEKLATKVEVNRVDLGFFNRIIIDDFVIYDQAGKRMLRAGRMSAKIDLLDLIEGKISVSSAQFFALDARLYKNSEAEAPNFQFVIDSLASKDTTSHTPLNLHIGSLVIRNSNVSYDRNDLPKTNGRFNPNHLEVKQLSSHIMLYELTDDNIDLNVKHLSFKENSGLHLKNLSLLLTADKRNLALSNFQLELPNTNIAIPQFTASYTIDDGKFDITRSASKWTLNINSFDLDDIACFVPFDTRGMPVLSGIVKGDSRGDDINCTSYIVSNDNSLTVKLNGSAKNATKRPFVNITKLDIDAKEQFLSSLSGIISLPQQVLALGDVSIKGEGSGTEKNADATLHIVSSNVGQLNLKGSYDNGMANAKIETSDMNLQKLLGNDSFGLLAANLTVGADLSDISKPRNISLNGTVGEMFFNGYSYHDINLEGTYKDDIITYLLSIADQNVSLSASGNAAIGTATKHISTAIDVEHISPQNLNLSSKWGNAIFALRCNGDLSGSSIDNITGSVSISDFTQHGGRMGDVHFSDDYHIDNISLISENNGSRKKISLASDFLNVGLNGKFTLSSLANSLRNILAQKLPSLALSKENNAAANNMTFNADLKDTQWLKRFLGIDININKPLTLKGFINDSNHQANIYLDVPSIDAYNHHFEDVKLLVWTPENAVQTSMSLVLRDNMKKDGNMINFEATAQNDNINSTVSWNENRKSSFHGVVHSSAALKMKADGSLNSRITISPSDICIGDSIWHLHSKGIEYSNNSLIVDNFAIENSNQFIHINGKASASPDDIITASLKNVNVAYIMNLVNFHSVEFGGFASGNASARCLFSTPEATAHLDVDEFLFEEGHLGDLHVDAKLNNTDEQIDIDGYTDDEIGKRMDIKGYVSPQKNSLDLAIDGDRINLEFLHTYCSAFLEDIDAEAKARMRVYGQFSNINLTGQAIANGAVTVSSLNCRYTLKDAEVNFIPDDILVNRMPLYDKYGNVAYMTGGLHHKHLTRMTYDFDIETHNFLGYDFHDFGESTFYGTAFLTGNCKLKGRSSELDINVSGDVEKGSRIVYNASSPDAITKQEFITWNSRNKVDNDTIANEVDNDEEVDNVRTNIHMNFLINVTPESSLYLVMDPSTGDYIDLHGSGGLRASYYNKGSFDLFGNFLIDHGTYKMTIQNIIRRDFAFQPGGTITFGGDPFNANLSLQALYTVNSVPLSDLNIGTSFSSNNIRVNCLMNITGTAGAPKVEFDMDLPTVNTEAKQMIYSLINSEEEMNQQVLYLLSVGRFYSQTGNNAGMEDNKNIDATTIAMQSIVSGTLSQQINNVLGSVIKNRNWNFGANISPGDEGFTNAEYEGLLNGSLFNNRLLFNGQFGYRDNALTSQQGFIGDFDIRYLLIPNGNFAVRVYNQTNDRYFTRNSLNTQGLGLILKRDFSSWREIFRSRKNTSKVEK